MYNNQLEDCPICQIDLFRNALQYKIANIRIFHKLDEIGNNANIGIRGFSM